MMLSDIYDFETGMVKPSIELAPDIVYVADIEPVKLSVGELFVFNLIFTMVKIAISFRMKEIVIHL